MKLNLVQKLFSGRSTMEEILLRFSHIGQAIFKELNGRDFCQSREVNRQWYHFISNERALQKAYKKQIEDKIQSLNDEIEGYNYLRNWNLTPFHLAAERGYLPACQQIMESAHDKNPKTAVGVTPLHEAAKNGHLSVCQLIIENVDDKNPKNRTGWTPLHEAAWSGHLSICQLIVENIDDKNPKDNKGITPYQMTWNPEIKKLIENAIQIK